MLLSTRGFSHHAYQLVPWHTAFHRLIALGVYTVPGFSWTSWTQTTMGKTHLNNNNNNNNNNKKVFYFI